MPVAIIGNSFTRDENREITMPGKAPAGAVVKLTVDGAFVGQDTADSGDNWTVTFPIDVGDHSADAEDDQGGSVVDHEFEVLDPEAPAGGAGKPGGGK